MVEVGDYAPDFRTPVVQPDGTIEALNASEHLDEAPIVLAFFPAAFTAETREKMAMFQDYLPQIREAGGTLYGMSVDSPYSLREFSEQLDFDFPLLSDYRRSIIDRWEVRMDLPDIEYFGVAKRAEFVINSAATVTYKWEREDPRVRPFYEEIIEAVGETS